MTKRIISSCILSAIIICSISCSSPKEKNLIHIGQMIVDDNLETLQQYDMQRLECCNVELTPYYVMIEKIKEFDSLELYSVWLTEMGNSVDVVQNYKGRKIAISYNDKKKSIHIPSDTCGIIITDERDWRILYDTKNDRYVAVETTGFPDEKILQLNRRDWNDRIMIAIDDTSVDWHIPEAPSLE